jgi:CxxC motif-containing protein (DUF1111 family)
MRPATRLTWLLCVGAAVACTDDAPTAPETPRAPDAPPPDSAERVAGGPTRDPRARTALSGGALTVFDDARDAFSHAAPNLDVESVALHEEGDDAFEAVFVSDGAAENGGLGPVFDNVACEGCHTLDGRGRPPRAGESIGSLLFRASLPGQRRRRGPTPAPGFGLQLQQQAMTGFAPEVRVLVTYAESLGTFSDGSPYRLRVPQYTVQSSYAPLPAGLQVSPRVAPAVVGLGLLEAVPDAEVLARADPQDRDGDGVSGHANVVWEAVLRRYALGRFGWKASVPSLLQQNAGAYNGDMGVTSTLLPAEPCEGDRAGCERHDAEIDEATLEAVTFYTRTLGVPARRNLDDAAAQRGEELFYKAGCAGCHTPTLTTGELPGVPAVSGQTIHAYTDLLLHDMGPGLADARPDFTASGSEWRTPPLWGIGLVRAVSGHTEILHDGRARSLLEAILWHAGEAARARDAVRRMTAPERYALVAFLESL